MSHEGDQSKQDHLVDYYTLFNLDFNATPNEIKAAYKDLSLRFHPDKIAINFPHASPLEIEKYHKQYLMIQQGWGILSNEETKKEYNSTLKQKNLLTLESHYTLYLSQLELDIDDNDGNMTTPCHRCASALLVGNIDDDSHGGHDLFIICQNCNMRYCIKFGDMKEEEDEQAGE